MNRYRIRIRITHPLYTLSSASSIATIHVMAFSKMGAQKVVTAMFNPDYKIFIRSTDQLDDVPESGHSGPTIRDIQV